MKQVIVTVLLLALCVGGVWVSGNLLQLHTAKPDVPSWFSNACGETDQPEVSNCDAVSKSKYGTLNIPYVGPTPAALLGQVYFVGLGLWFVFVGQPSRDRRFWHLLLLVMIGCGVLGSLGFIYLMYVVLKQTCFWCMVSHAINFAIFILTFFLWPKKQQPASTEPRKRKTDSAQGRDKTPAPAEPPHPSFTLVAAVVLMVAIAAGWLWQGHRASVATNRAVALKKACDSAVAKCKERLDVYTENVDMLFQVWSNQPKHDIPVRPDDPKTETPEGKISYTAVVFSDFQCPFCRKLAKFMDEEVRPVFNNQLRIVFKHYPLDNECNPYVKTARHPQACKASKAAEAARLQGGSGAFWKMHDVLFAASARRKLDDLDYRKVATALGLDPDRLIKDMQSEQVAERILEDIKLAKKIGLKGTPAVYISGRAVPSEARAQIEFWKEANRRFQILIRRIQARRQAQQSHQHAEPDPAEQSTEDSQDQ